MSSSKATAINRIANRLKEAIDHLPLVSMISSVRYPGEPGYNDVRKAEADATNAIKALSVLARTGQMDAAIALRNLGNLAAKELGSVLSRPANGIEKKGCASPLETPNHQSVYSLPILDIAGDLSPITDILKSEAETIDTLSKEDILEKVGNPLIAGRRRFVVNALPALGIPKNVLDEHRSKTSHESVSYDHPMAILEILYAEVEGKDLIPMYERKECARIAMYALIGRLLEDRLSKPSKTGSEELPLNSFEWPLCVSAFSNDLPKRYESLKLGHSLRFVPRRTVDKGVGKNRKSAGGRPRLINPGSPAHFALEYCVALDDARRSYIHSSDTEKAGWAKTIRRIENVLKLTEEAEPIRNPDLVQDLKNLYQGPMLRILWTCKAALLPEFPYPERESDAAAKEDLEKWVDAAVARARMNCSNDWEFYRGWPKCVDVRNSQKESAYYAVKEKLKEGMERLELTKIAAP
jgi:hypothetical protein